MFRKWPLTTLFIIATICVDLAVMLNSKPGAPSSNDETWSFYFWNMGMPAQFSVLALWSVFGNTHRLTKAACATAAFAILLGLIGLKFQPIFRGDIIAFSFIQFLTVLAGAACFRICGIGKVVQSANNPMFRISLVEIFGWSLVAALWAFAIRYANEGLLIDKYFMAWVGMAAVVPLLLVPVLFSSISVTWRLITFTISILFAFVGYVITDRYIPDNPISLWALTMSVTQISYISAWWAVTRMDEAMQERQAISEASREKLKVFEPDSR
jgi:hypothetical protein